MKLIKQLYFQMGILIFIFLLYLIALGNNIATTFFVVLLLCACYIMANMQQHKSANWLRVILYAVLAYYLFGFIASLPISIHIVKLFQHDITSWQLMQRLYFDFFWSLFLIGVLAFVLIFNKPVPGSFGIKKLISKF